MKSNQQQAQRKATFRSKDPVSCPICGEAHQREQMFQGGGRLIAGALTRELRRLYEKNKKFGRLNPSDYAVSVCPRCLYASFIKDWSSVNLDEINRIKQYSNDRRVFVEKILGPVDFDQDRNIVSGAASYLLAVDCYQHRLPATGPTPKKAVCAIRAAWYFEDLHNEFSQNSFDKLRDFLYQKAAIWYGKTMEITQTGSETVDTSILGPDMDNNWGFDGVIYLNGYLSLKFRKELAASDDRRLELLVKAKRMLAKLYGSGKSSKTKPSAILDMAKESYDDLQKVIEEMGGEKKLG